MASLIVLLVWVTIGVTSSFFLREPGQARWEWCPVAAILGPLWIPIASERRAPEVKHQTARMGLDRGLPGLPAPAMAIVVDPANDEGLIDLGTENAH